MNREGVVRNRPIVISCMTAYIFSGELERVRFGYLNVESNFTMVYQPGESDDTVYPGIIIIPP